VLRARVLLAILLAAMLTGCGGSHSSPAAPDPMQSENTGDVVSNTLVDGDPAVAPFASWAQLITYVSHNATNDNAKNVTATAYVPKGQAPQGGYQVVALGGPVAGTGQGCAATTSADTSATTAALLQAGYLVVVPDYLGLSRNADNDANYHPFLDSSTVGQNMIDAVRATRTAVPQASASWVAMGTGQGGQAAWAANELADYYGWGLTLVGAIGNAPTADVDGLVDAAAAGTLTNKQELAYVAYLNALDKEYPDDFHLDDYRRGVAKDNWDLLLGCRSDQAAQRAAVTAKLAPDDLRPTSPDALATLHGYLAKTNLPQAPTKSPMLVSYGTQDPLIPAAWTERALYRACALGDVIAIKQPDDAVPLADPTSTLAWIADRFAGDTPAPNDCPQFTATNPPPVSSPVATAPSAPQAASTFGTDTQARTTGLSLIGGWLPIAIQVVALAAVVAAIGLRSRQWRLRRLPIAGGVGVAVTALAYSYVDYEGWGHDPPYGMWAWIAATGFAIAVAIMGWPSARWWRRAVAFVAIPLAAISAAVALNVSLGYLPTVRSAWDMATGVQPPDWIDEGQLADLVHDGARPTRGTIVTITVPDDQSGFAHRQEMVYLPPAWFASSPPPRLPAVMMMGGEMGHPGDWLYAGDALRTLDEFALRHRGVAPVVVFADSSGNFANDTECVNGPRGNAADHLTKEVVPYLLSHFGVSSAPANWGLAGWSSGATCALTLAVMHPEVFSAFVDLDGQLGPSAGGKDQTVARLFGGDAAAWAAFDPKSVVAARGRYVGMSAWVGVSEDAPTKYWPAGLGAAGDDPTDDDWDPSSEEHASTAPQLCGLLSAHGIECAVSSYGGSHDYPSAANGFAAALPWLAGKLDTPGVPWQPLPGAGTNG
jgi:S-formylglutathione hydrolase FrmB